MNTMQKFSITDLVIACYYICCFSGFQTEEKSVLSIIAGMTNMQNFSGF